MNLLDQICKRMNNPVIGYNSIPACIIKTIISKLEIESMTDLVNHYGEDWDKGLRKDYLDWSIWKTKDWSL